MSCNPIPNGVIIPILNLMSTIFADRIPISILAFWDPPELPPKLFLQHPLLSLSYFSKLFQIPPTKQFQRPKNHVVRFNHRNDPIIWYQFSVLVRLFIARKTMPDKAPKGENVYFNLHFRRFQFITTGAAHLRVNRKQWDRRRDWELCIRLKGSSQWPTSSS
jgi:hypothetical protein